jgi:hypothetical protein
METFLDPLTKAPIAHIAMAEGDTKVVGIKIVKLSPPDGVNVFTNQAKIAICHSVAKLKKPKNAYDQINDMFLVASDTSPVEIWDAIYF